MENPTAEEVIHKALDLDLTEIGEGGLPEDVVRNRVESFSGPVVVQIQKVRNVSAPKSNPESESAPKLLRVQLTDGTSYCSGLQWEKWHSISLSTPPGSKILLKSDPIPISNGFLLLSEKHFKFLGGRVPHLIEKWQVAKNLSQHNRVPQQEGCAPPWVPFGQKIDMGSLKDVKSNFKSLDQCQKDTKPNEAFEKHRQMTIAEVSRAKEGKVKVFGGVKQPQDGDIAQLVGFGYSVNEAVNALKMHNCDLAAALHSLQKAAAASSRKDRTGGRPETNRKKREPRERETGEDKALSRPSGPSTLFDFLQNQISLPKVPEIEDIHATVAHPGDAHRGGEVADRNRRAGRPQHDQQDCDGPSQSGRQYQQQRYRSNQEYGGRRNEREFSYQNHSGGSAQSHYRNSAGYQNDGSSSQGRQQRKDTKPSGGGDWNHSSIPPRLQHVQGSRSDGRTFCGGEGGDRRRMPRSDEAQQQQIPGVPRDTGITDDGAGPDTNGTRHQQKRFVSGQKVLAKYWEDGKFYRSIVHEVSSNGNTCVVKFVDYGNHEEVLCSDVQAVSPAQWEKAYAGSAKQDFHQQQHSHPNSRQYNHDYRYGQSESSYLPGEATTHHASDGPHDSCSREYRPQRGGRPQHGRGSRQGGPGSNQQHGRPSQRYYQPPAQRRNVPS